jgi:hypothetical protein
MVWGGKRGRMKEEEFGGGRDRGEVELIWI